MVYWKYDGKVSIFDVFECVKVNYVFVMECCCVYDEMILNDVEKVGGKEYFELCVLVYCQVIVVYKLFKDVDGNLFFFFKENNSNGCINIVDLIYLFVLFFLVYNFELQKGMMISIFEYSVSGCWNKFFLVYDLGIYFIVNGQVYGGDMLIEEGGNMVVLVVVIVKVEGNVDYVKKYWDLLIIWIDYLVEYG